MILYTLLKPLAIFIFKILFHIKVFGKGNIPKSGGFILASNHLSYLDPIVLGVACPRRLNFMARHDLFSGSLFSWLISNLGAFPIKRGAADISALKEAMKRLKNGKVLAIFPEGTRGFEGKGGQPHAGIGFLAASLNLPVIPTFISGTEVVLPKGAKFMRLNKISVHFGKPRSFYYSQTLANEKGQGKQIPQERRLPYQDIAEEIMRDIRRLSC